MKNILQVNASILGEYSVSKSLSDFATDWLSQQHGAKVTVRQTEGLPHLTGEMLTSLSTNAVELDAEASARVDISNRLIAEIEEADVVVLGVPTYNFFIPSQLKSYFDLIARAGVTFRYTESGPVGLLSDKRVYVLNASGGVYQATGEDLIGPYIKKILGFVGIKDVHFVHAEGLALGRGANKDRIIAQAKERLYEILAVDAAVA